MSANSPIVRQWFKRPQVSLPILAVGLILSVLVITVTLAGTQSVTVATENEGSIQRGVEASVARYIAMGESYAPKDEGIQRGMEANVARYTTMGEYYAAKEKADIQRGIEASVARYTAMAELYDANRK